MTENKIRKMKPNDKLIHRRYGVVNVIRLITTLTNAVFGITVEPVTDEGKQLLLHDSGSTIPQLLETNYRLLNELPRNIITAPTAQL